MKNASEEAGRWLRQAEYDRAQAERTLQVGAYSYAAYFAEQTSQKALKAFLLSRGRRFVPSHSVGELAKEASRLDARLAPLAGRGKKLDRLYLASRYPDALPAPAIPAESYTCDDAEEAVGIARATFTAAGGAIEPPP